MKGRFLNINELKNMDEQYVYIKPIEKGLEDDEGKAQVKIYAS